jgi:hypothetical protein
MQRAAFSVEPCHSRVQTAPEKRPVRTVATRFRHRTEASFPVNKILQFDVIDVTLVSRKN